MEGPEDVLKQNSEEFINKLDAKDLLIKLRKIFPASVAQELERSIDRDGNNYAIMKFLDHLPRQDSWLESFCKVLRQMKKPHLLKLLEPFLEAPQQHSYSLPAQITDPQPYSNSPPKRLIPDKQKKGIQYTVHTQLRDIDYFPFLSEIYPHIPANWNSLIASCDGLSLECTLYDLLEHFGDKDIIAYQKLKDVTNLRHALVRQDTQASEIDNHSSLLPDTNSNLFPEYSQIIADQEKALKKLGGSTTQSLPMDFCTDDKDFLSTMPVRDLKKKTVRIDEIESVVPTKREVPPLAEERKEVPPLAEERKEVPPLAEERKEVPPIAEERKEVPPIAEERKEVPPIAEERKEVPPLAEERKEVPPLAEERKEVLPVAEVKKEVPPVSEVEKEVPPIAEVEKEVPPIAEVEKEVEPVAEVEKEVEPVAEVEVLDVPKAQEPENLIEASLPTDTNRSRNSTVLYVGILGIAMALSFTFGYLKNK